MNLAYRTWGQPDQPAVLLLHGFLGNGDDWLPLASALAQGRYLVAIDLPGQGRSVFPRDDRFKQDPLAATCRMIDQVVTGLSLSRVTLVGYSLGGRIAMAYGLYRPDLLNCLVIESAHPGLASAHERHQRWQSDRRWARRFSQEPLGAVLEDWYQQPVFKDLSPSRRRALISLRQQPHSNSLAWVLKAFSLAGQPDYRLALAAADFPVYYLAGGQDGKFTGIGQQLLKEGILAGLQVFARCGHNIHRAQPESMAAVISRLSEPSLKSCSESFSEASSESFSEP